MNGSHILFLQKRKYNRPDLPFWMSCILVLLCPSMSHYWYISPICIFLLTYWYYPFLQDSVRQLLSTYLHRFSSLAGPVITCGPVLNWLELDNRGHRLIVTEDCAINTPAVAAAYATKRYAKQANDEISFEVSPHIY